MLLISARVRFFALFHRSEDAALVMVTVGATGPEAAASAASAAAAAASATAAAAAAAAFADADVSPALVLGTATDELLNPTALAAPGAVHVAAYGEAPEPTNGLLELPELPLLAPLKLPLEPPALPELLV